MVIDRAETEPEDERLPADLKRAYRRMAALAEIDLHAATLSDVLDRVAVVATDLLPADLGASVLLWDENAKRFLAASTTVEAKVGHFPVEKVRSEGGTSRRVIDSREQIAVVDTSVGDINPVAIEAGIAAFVATPIISKGRSLGVLYANSGTTRVWSGDDLWFLSTLAHRAATAMQAAESADDARFSRERAEALSQVANALMGLNSLTEVLQTIVESVAASIAADHVRLSVDAHGTHEPQLVTGGPSADAEFCDRCTAVVDHALERAAEATYAITLHADEIAELGNDEISAVTSAPLRYQNNLVGYLTAVRRSGSAPFDADDAALLTGMATQAVVAIDNARLMGDTQEALAELSAVFEIVQAQNSAVELAQMLQAMTEVVAGALPAYRVTLAAVQQDSHQADILVSGGRGDDVVDVDLVDAELAKAFEATRNEPTIVRDAVGGSRLVVPLIIRNEPIGILVAENPEGTLEFVENALELVSVMGSQVAVAMANARLFEETQKLATTDSLTGLHNRRQLFELGGRSMAAAQRYGRPLTALMLDIDHFKQVNDTYGHSVGDEVLREVTRRCRRSVREVDILGRYGGEEFAAILPETPRTGAMGVAERLREAVGSAPIYTSAGPIPIKISIGVAALDEDVADLKALFEIADNGLYEAKRSGRNRVRAG